MKWTEKEENLSCRIITDSVWEDESVWFTEEEQVDYASYASGADAVDDVALTWQSGVALTRQSYMAIIWQLHGVGVVCALIGWMT